MLVAETYVQNFSNALYVGSAGQLGFTYESGVVAVAIKSLNNAGATYYPIYIQQK
jgi:hypothetical protein